jgi:hypothetical protein
VIVWWCPLSIGSLVWFVLAEIASEAVRVLGR